MRAPLLAGRACANQKRAREAGRPSQQGARSGRLRIVGSGQSREHGVGQEVDRRALEAVALVALPARAARMMSVAATSRATGSTGSSASLTASLVIRNRRPSDSAAGVRLGGRPRPLLLLSSSLLQEPAIVRAGESHSAIEHA